MLHGNDRSAIMNVCKEWCEIGRLIYDPSDGGRNKSIAVCCLNGCTEAGKFNFKLYLILLK